MPIAGAGRSVSAMGRGDPTGGSNRKGKTTITLRDILSANRELELEADLVVLVTGMVPRADNKVGTLFKLPREENHFFNEGPYEAASGGDCDRRGHHRRQLSGPEEHHRIGQLGPLGSNEVLLADQQGYTRNRANRGGGEQRHLQLVREVCRACPFDAILQQSGRQNGGCGQQLSLQGMRHVHPGMSARRHQPDQLFE